MIKRVNVLDAFVEGAKNGLKTAFKILPVLILVLTSTSMLRASGAMDIITGLLRPVGERILIPSELIPLWIMRPISGGGSIALMSELLGELGADTALGRIAAIMTTSTETTIYTLAVYSSGLKIKNLKLVLIAGLLADTVAVLASVFAVNIFF